MTSPGKSAEKADHDPYGSSFNRDSLAKEAASPSVPSAPPADAAGASAAGVREDKVVDYVDASTYKGQTINGLRDGYGEWVSKTSKYEGQWVNDVQHGKGRQEWKDGRVYEGHFQKGKFHGFGRFVWRTTAGTQLTYEGEYQNDLKHGTGKFIWHDGRMYDGEWVNGHRHGKALYSKSENDPDARVGFWRDDKFDYWESAETTDNGKPGESQDPLP